MAFFCAVIATLALKKKPKPVPSLPSRLRVAVASPPIPRTMVGQAAKETILAARSGVASNSTTMGILMAATALSGFLMGRRLTSDWVERDQAGSPKG